MLRILKGRDAKPAHRLLNRTSHRRKANSDTKSGFSSRNQHGWSSPEVLVASLHRGKNRYNPDFRWNRLLPNLKERRSLLRWPFKGPGGRIRPVYWTDLICISRTSAFMS